MIVRHLVLASLAVVFTWSQPQKDTNICSTQKTCGDCIAVTKDCTWCSQEKFSEDKSPCDTRESLREKGCAEEHISDPQSKVDRTVDKGLADGTSVDDAVQIQPQNVTINLRPNKPVVFTLKFRQAENYPVDLYYLMDLSYSMRDDKVKLAALGGEIAGRMKDITKNFRLGFGSFVDKVTMPYVSTIEKKLKSPCPGCVPAYGFRHQLTLNPDSKKFQKKVREASISGNLDSPEGGFDAIIQAITCGDIGWRSKSRRMLLFSTDASSHFAGDGKLGGIVKPNDGKCHLDSKGYYSKSLEQDYPSVSQISAKVSEKRVNVIFAVTDQQFKLYERLSNIVEGSTVGRLSNDSSNIVKLVEKNYNLITSKVELNVKHAEGVKVTLKSRCRRKVGELKETNTCKDLKIGDEVDFEVEVSMTGCPKDRKQWERDIEISAVGLNDALGIKLKMLCECDCEKPDNHGPQYDKCSNGQGVYACGICDCKPKYTGQFCQCNGTDSAGDAYQSRCIKNGTDLVCMGRGTCNCGECTCKSVQTDHGLVPYEGWFCGCDNLGCAYHTNGLMCGGPSKGYCKCGKCSCYSGWEGDTCGCTTNNSTCMAKSGVECNKHGECQCGVCDCYKSDGKYSGASCEECATCGGGVHCKSSIPCVQCRVFKTGVHGEAECSNTCPNITVVKYSLLGNTTTNEELCFLYDEDDCKVHYKYAYLNDGKLAYTVSEQKQCPEPVNILAIVLGVIGGIVLIGIILLLIWKCITTIQDRREYAKFQESNEHAKWDAEENPIYKKATSTFKNPTYQSRG